jgi:hypothetical protein
MRCSLHRTCPFASLPSSSISPGGMANHPPKIPCEPAVGISPCANKACVLETYHPLNWLFAWNVMECILENLLIQHDSITYLRLIPEIPELLIFEPRFLSCCCVTHLSLLGLLSPNTITLSRSVDRHPQLFAEMFS